ncbi:MAG: fimbrillin family protein [Prevotellaceae bacterium]|jgi:hypothetical protein|nr:fimbrillin family protein [Prevotellaceae bacterium]
MKTQLVTYRFFAILALLLLCGCNKETSKPEVEVVMEGAIGLPTRASIDPPAGHTGPTHIPPYQLSIGVAMVSHVTSNPLTIQPSNTAWNGADWERAYFGGPGLGANPVTNGEIKFTNNTGTSVKRMLYNEDGSYFFFKAIHPYEGATFQNGILYYPIDGSQDIMMANMGWGNVDNPVVTPLVFKHLLTKLNFVLVAENNDAIGQYGTIDAIEVLDQPNQAKLQVATGELTPNSTNSTRYSATNFSTGGLSTTPVQMGYVMVFPGVKYSVRVHTELRLAFYVDVTFSSPPLTPTLPGRAYNVTLKFMSADEIFILTEEVDEWWLDSTFD